ncbi:MAG: hypothetical protein U5K37_11655 [Natrialbaceae archaeon]|nr:hypothetical protein [Natrialbaceae archaeon]
MSEVSRVQGAIEEALADVKPGAFRERIDEHLVDIRYTPAVCTMRAARAVDGTVSDEAAAERAAGVQLSYEGLALTRSLIDEEALAGGTRRGIGC